MIKLDLKTKIILPIIIYLGIFGLAKISLAADHYVSSSGSAAWADCTNADTPCSLATANTNADAGDVVYLKGGTYPYTTIYVSALNPTHSGTVDDWITFRNVPGETPELVGTYGTRMWGLMIQGVSYVRLDGLIFSDFSDAGLVRGYSHHIEIKNCIFRTITSPYRGVSGLVLSEGCIGGGSNNCPVNNIWVHHNTFYKLMAGGGYYNGVDCANGISEGGDALRIGQPSNISPAPTGDNTNITVENNYMAYAGHAVMDSYSINSVFKNNVAHNEPWYPADNGACIVNYQPDYTNDAYDGLYSHRIWQITDTFDREYSYNLIEQNRLGHSGINPNNNGSTGLVIASPGNIVRYNAAYGTMHNPMKTKYGDGYGWQASGGTRNRIYNNTLYKGGYGYPTFENKYPWPLPLQGFRWYAPADSAGNELKNNIVYGSYGAMHGSEDIQDDNSEGIVYANNFCTNADPEKCSAHGDPLFVNPDLSQTDSLTFPDLHLQATSPAIDGGKSLTQTNGAGENSTTLYVDDALYFQDGSWGSDLARGVTFFSDWIAIGDINNVSEISSIDYANNTITLVSPMTWNDNDPIWLYKKSDGARVLYGSSSDYGANEYVESGEDITAPAAPSGLSVK